MRDIFPPFGHGTLTSRPRSLKSSGSIRLDGPSGEIKYQTPAAEVLWRYLPRDSSHLTERSGNCNPT